MAPPEEVNKVRDYYREYYNVCYKVDFTRNVFKIWDLDYENSPLYEIEDDPLHTISLTALRCLDGLHSNNLHEPLALEHLGFRYCQDSITSMLDAFDLATFKGAVLPWLHENDHDAYTRFMEVKVNMTASMSNRPFEAFSKYINQVINIFITFRNMPELPEIPYEAGLVRPRDPRMACSVINVLGLWPKGKIAVPQFGSHFDSWELEILAELLPNCHIMEDTQGQFALKSRFVDLFGIISSCATRIEVKKLMPISEQCTVKHVNLQRKSPLIGMKRKSSETEIPNHVTHCHSSGMEIDSSDNEVTSCSEDMPLTESKRLTMELEKLWIKLGCPELKYDNPKKELGSSSVESVDSPSPTRRVQSARVESQSPSSEILRSRAASQSPDMKVSSPGNVIGRPKVEPASSTFYVESYRNFLSSPARQPGSASPSSDIPSSWTEPQSPARKVPSPRNAIGRPKPEPASSTFNVESCRNYLSSLTRQLESPSLSEDIPSRNSPAAGEGTMGQQLISPGETKYPEAYAHVRKYAVKSFDLNSVSLVERNNILLGGELGAKYNNSLSKRSKTRFMKNMPSAGGTLEVVLEALVPDYYSFGKRDEAIMFAAGRIVASKAQFSAYQEKNGEIYIQGLA